MRRWTNVGLMLGQRLWRWPNIKPTQDEYLSVRRGARATHCEIFRLMGSRTSASDGRWWGEFKVLRSPDQCPESTRRWPNAGVMLGQCRRQSASITPALVGCLVFVSVWPCMYERSAQFLWPETYVTVVNDFRWFLSQFSTNCHEITRALLFNAVFRVVAKLLWKLHWKLLYSLKVILFDMQ